MIRTLLAMLMVLLLVSGCASPPEPTRTQTQTLAPAPTATFAAPTTAASPSPPAPTAALAAPAASPSPPAPTTAAAKSALSTEALLMSSIAGMVTDIDGMQAYYGEGIEAMGQAELIQGSTSAGPRGSWMHGGRPLSLQVSWNPGALRQPTPVASRVPAGFTAPLPDTGRIAAPPEACPAGAKPEVAFKTKGGETVTPAMFTSKDLRAISQEYFVDPPPGRSLMEYMESLVNAGDPRLLLTSGGWNQVLWDQLEALQSPTESLMDYQNWTVSPAIEQEMVEVFLSRLSSMGLPAIVINAFKGSRTSGWLANRSPVADDMLARMEIEAVLSGSLEGTVHEMRDVSIPAPRTYPVFGPQTGDGSVVWNHPTEGKVPFEVNILLDAYDDLGRAIAGTVTGESQTSGYRFEIRFKADGTKEGQLFRNGVEVGKLTMTVDAETFHNYLNLETDEEEQLEKPSLP